MLVVSISARLTRETGAKMFSTQASERIQGNPGPTTMNFRTPSFDPPPPSERQLQSPLELALVFWELAVRYRMLIAKTIGVFVLLAIVDVLVTPKQFLATAEMVIDPRKSTVGSLEVVADAIHRLTFRRVAPCSRSVAWTSQDAEVLRGSRQDLEGGAFEPNKAPNGRPSRP